MQLASFPLAAIPGFPEAEVRDFTCGVGEQNLTLKVGEIPSKLDFQIRARSLPNSKLPSNHCYYKQIIPPFGRRGDLNNKNQTSEAFEVYREVDKYAMIRRLKWD
ncbi:unnamed protein product [Rangifer tarandus platyrhynchus]|uniref:Uncharacterized protein n=1 Tax=Rangifer tarandus platyrhynchus TaxID=3082113 RepID=A0AC59Y9G6_RANTA